MERSCAVRKAAVILLLVVAGCSKPQAPVYLTSSAPPPAAPTSYDDCVLQSVKPGLSNMATEAVLDACRSKFPDQPSNAATRVDPANPYADLIPAEQATPASIAPAEAATITP
jgi:hypothetical protein